MRSLQRLLVLLSLPCAVGADDPRSATLGVQLEGILPPSSATQAWVLPRQLQPVSTEIATGRLLLHRRGCTGCHDLDLPSYPHPRGPALDKIGRKTDATWLDLWLQDPSSYLPHSRMPRLRLGDASRARLVSWLATLGAPDSLTQATSLQEPAAGDAYRGGRLFAGLQ